MGKDIELKQTSTKPLGKYLVEAGIVTSAQLEIVLSEQRKTEKRLGEILSERGWVKQATIEYVVEKVILPEREANKEKLFGKDLSRLNAQLAPNLNLNLSSQKIVRFLLVLVFSIISASIVIQFGTYILPGYPLQETLVSLFNIDGEQTVPAFFSWSLLLFCTSLLGAIAYSKKVTGDRYASQWTVLAAIFLFMSVDEAMEIHERIGFVIADKLNTSGFFFFAWTIPGSIFVVIFLVTFLRFINHLPTKIKYLFLLAGSMYVGGALIVEMYNGYYRSLHSDNPIYYAFTTVEESMEMLGIVTFIYGLLTYIRAYMKGICLQINIPGQSEKSKNKS